MAFTLQAKRRMVTALLTVLLAELGVCLWPATGGLWERYPWGAWKGKGGLLRTRIWSSTPASSHRAC